jgi:MFS transporter, PHS family, inorganic phosphate transporter
MEEPVQTQRQRWRENIKFLWIAGGGLFGDGYLNTTIGLGMYLLTIQSG